MSNGKYDVNDLKQKLAAFFEMRMEVVFAYLFGSVACDRATPISDIDVAVAVDFSRIHAADYPYGYQAGLTSHLMHVLNSNNVDLVLLNEAAPAVKYRIFTSGISVFCRNLELERKAFIRAFQQYQDTAPLRKIQMFYLQRYLKGLGESRFHGRS